jgi:hypothetical protein
VCTHKFFISLEIFATRIGSENFLCLFFSLYFIASLSPPLVSLGVQSITFVGSTQRPPFEFRYERVAKMSAVLPLLAAAVCASAYMCAKRKTLISLSSQRSLCSALSGGKAFLHETKKCRLSKLWRVCVPTKCGFLRSLSLHSFVQEKRIDFVCKMAHKKEAPIFSALLCARFTLLRFLALGNFNTLLLICSHSTHTRNQLNETESGFMGKFLLPPARPSSVVCVCVCATTQ